MPKAIWNGTILAENDKTIVVEGNHYFPPESINRQYFQASETQTVCFWKGVKVELDQEKARSGLFERLGSSKI